MNFAKDVVDGTMNLFTRKPVHKQNVFFDPDHFSGRKNDYYSSQKYDGRPYRVPGVDRRVDQWNQLAVPQCKLCN